MSKKLPKPFDYYWKMYTDSKCPFCGEPLGYTFNSEDIIYCSQYGGYCTIYQDATYAGHDGLCKNCVSMDPIQDGKNYSKEKVEGMSIGRSVMDGQGFLCEHCHHGINFDKMEVFQELFEKHDEKSCAHCSWHNQRSPNNPINQPGD